MGRFERSERGGGQPDPQEALRRAREAVARERRSASEDVVEGREPRDDREDALEDVEEAMREHDEHARGRARRLNAPGALALRRVGLHERGDLVAEQPVVRVEVKHLGEVVVARDVHEVGHAAAALVERR